MSKQKKNWVLRFASLALLLTLVTTCLSSYTFAKYTTAFAGYDTARVAKLAFGADMTTTDENGNTLTSGATLGTTATQVDIFKTAYDSADSSLTGLGASQTTIQTINSDKIIAPGIFGGVSFDLSGTSEVSLRITFDITETNTGGIPMLYKYNNKYFSDYYAAGTHYLVLDNDGATRTTVVVAGDFDDLADEVADVIGIVDAGTSIATHLTNKGLTASDLTLSWYWPFEEWDAATGGALIAGSGVGSDAYDTALGLSGTDTITLSIAATATQVD